MKPLILDKVGSLNTRHSPESIDPPQFIKARNVRLHRDEIATRPGSTLILVDPYDNQLDLNGIGAFHDLGGKDVVVVLDSNDGLWGTNPYPGQPVGSCVITSGSSACVIADGNYLKLEVPAFPLTAGVYMDTAAAYGRLFMCFSDNLSDGVNNGTRQLYFKTNTSQYRYVGVGLTSSSAPATYAQSATVGDIAAGTRYGIVIFETETGYQSGYTIQAIGKAVIAADGFKIDVSGIPVHADGHVTKRIIAFTQAGASSEGPYFYIPEDDYIEGLNGAVDGNGNNISKTVIENNTATTATFNFPDEYLLGSTDITGFIDKGSAPSPKSIFFGRTVKRLITCGEDSDTFRFSEVNDPETFMQSTGLLKAGEGDEGIAMCAREFRRELYLLKNNGGHLAQATTLTPAEWGVLKIWSDVGPEGPWAIDVSEDFMAFAHRSGPYLFRGEAPEWIGYEVTGNKNSDFPNWDQINWDYAHLIYVCIDTQKKLVKFGVPLNASTKVNYEFIVDYTDGWKTRRWSYDDVASTRTIMAKRPSVNQKQALVASNALDGKLLFEDETSLTLDGGGAINQEIRWGFAPTSETPGVFVLSEFDIKIGGNGEASFIIYGANDENPTQLEITLAGFVKEFHKGITNPPQNEQFSIEITNKGEAGNSFNLQRVGLYMAPMWQNRITS